MQKQHPIATWSQKKDYWQTLEMDIFGHSVAYSETLPKSGTTLDGQLYELPTLVPPTIVPESSSSHGPVFSTPDTMPDAPNTGSNMKHQPAGLGNQVKAVFPTPCAGDNVNDTESQHNRNSPSLTQVSKHFPTPQAVDGIMGRPRTTGRPIEKSTHLTTIVTLLPTPSASDGQRPEDMPSQARRNSPGITAVSAHFPTPAASDSTGGGQHPNKRKGHTKQLIDTVLELNGEDTPPLFDVGNE